MPEEGQIFSASTSRVYQTLMPLAEGGMGTVELAVRMDGSFTRLYAVKRLREAYRNEPSFRAMFMDEARIAGLLRHPHVVGVLDVGEDATGPFLAMDYVEGISASRLVARAAKADRPLPLQLCVRICMEAAEGLHAAHELTDAEGSPLELIHRDVSPQNLLIGFDGITRVVDFGIAKAMGRLTQTSTGMLKGKFGYMAPEQLRFHEPDRRSDIFSLGVVLYELCAGRRLYANREGMDGARRLLEEPPPDLGEERDDVPPALTALLFALLAKDPELRPGTAQEVARRLERVLAELIEMDGGRVEVAAHLEATFGEEHHARATRINELLRGGSVDVTPEVTLATVVDPPRRRPPRGVVPALALTLLIAGGATVWGLAGSGEEEPSAADVPDVEASPPVAAGGADEAEPAVAAASEEAGPPGAEEPGWPGAEEPGSAAASPGAASSRAGDAEAGPPGEAAPTEGATPASGRRRTTARRRRRRAPPSEASPIRTWGWR